MRRGIAILAAILLGVSGLASAAAEEKTVLTLYINQEDVPSFMRDWVIRSSDAIAAGLPEYAVRTVWTTSEELKSNLDKGEVSLFIASSGFFRHLGFSGVRDLAGSMQDTDGDPNRSLGTVFIVRSSQTDLTDIPSLKGKKVLLQNGSGFFGTDAVLGEFGSEVSAKSFRSPEQQLARYVHIEKSGESVPSLLDHLAKGDADAVALPACQIERTAAAEDLDTSWLRTLSPKGSVELNCALTSGLYPGIVISGTPNLSANNAQAVTRALLSAPARDHLKWGLVTNYSAVDAVIRKFELSFDHRGEGIRSILLQYKNWIIGIAALIVLLILHSVTVSWLIRKRTRHLQVALANQKRLQAESLKASRQIEYWEKIGTMGQMSSLFAHEMGQPLNAISFYVFGLKRLVSKPGAGIAPAMKQQILELLGSINEEFSRAYGIVEKVREYVKSKRKEGTRQDLVSIVRQAVSSFEKTSVSGRRHEIRIEAPQSPIWVTAKAMELELVVVNLLRNSLQAQTDPEKKVEVSITVRENGKRAELCVEDNGPVLSDESMRRLSETVLQSEKPEGLGLGLSIVRMLVEEHNGTVRFERAAPTGLRVVISLPEEDA